MGNVLYKDGRYECRRFHRECLYSVIEDVVLIVFGVEKQEGESVRWRDLGIRSCRPSPGGTVGFFFIISLLILVFLLLTVTKAKKMQRKLFKSSGVTQKHNHNTINVSSINSVLYNRAVKMN